MDIIRDSINVYIKDIKDISIVNPNAGKTIGNKLINH
jgi:hypothetical protein